jgi:two-component system chemotaxis response regulator CheB
MLSSSPRIEVVGTARNGIDALEKVAELKPDVIILDLYMDEMDGVAFLKEQMARDPLPVVICSSAAQEGEHVMAAMEAGAVEYVRKPTARAVDQVFQVAGDLIQKTLIAGSIPRDKLTRLNHMHSLTVSQSPVTPINGRNIDMVVIGLSTGGPQALRQLLPCFQKDFPVPVAVVQHIPVGYTGPLAERLNQVSQVEVLEAEEGLEMQPGRVILAKSGYHLVLLPNAGNIVSHLDLNPAGLPHRPAVDILFQSAAEANGQRVLGVVMTGMGSDGTTGSAWIKSQGGTIITEAEESCVVYGMPRSVVEAGLSDKSVPLKWIAEAILEAL